jgi:sodium transport system permease protein
MRWSIIRIIWLRELRDQLRDRRTLFMMAGLPLLLYPFLGLMVVRFALNIADRKITVGIVQGPKRLQEFPARGEWEPVLSGMSWFTVLPGAPGFAGLEAVAGASATTRFSQNLRGEDALISPMPIVALAMAAPAAVGDDGIARLSGAAAFSGYSRSRADFPLLIRAGEFDAAYLQPLSSSPLTAFGQPKLHIEWLSSPGREPLDERKVDVLLAAHPDFWSGIAHEQGKILLEYQESDEHSRLAYQRMQTILLRWRKHLKEVRFLRHNLSNQFDDPLAVIVPDEEKGGGTRNVVEMLVRLFPFMLVMWSLAGALYPAVDLCAGEKERGTMETLLISPAGREEIVWGKFLTIWLFSAASAMLNLVSIGVTTWVFASKLPSVGLTAGGLIWCVLLVLPLSAFFSAVCLAIGAYARSTKEGQYYLMPLFLITFPLVFLTLTPGVELNSFYSMVPVTGVALLMQRLLMASLPGQTWFYFVSVMAPIGLYSWLALRWAIDQFQREEVLFREAERVDIHLWLRRLFREKESRPTTGQALFCFALLIGLRWLSESLGKEIPLLARTGIITAAFVVAPPLFMAVLLTTRPRQVLAAWWPAWQYLAAAVLLIPSLLFVAAQTPRFPRLLELLVERQSLIASGLGDPTAQWWSLTVLLLAILTAAGKEIAFRGFIFAGLLKRMRPWPAILVSSFFFAAFHMNVFLLPPLFLLGIALGMLALRSGSLLPGILLHASGLYMLLVGVQADSIGLSDAGLGGLAGGCAAGAAALLWWQNRRSGSGLFEALLALPQPEDPPGSGGDGAQLTPAPATTKSI